MSTKTFWEQHPLLGTLWKTKTSRFHAADRLRTRAWWKGISLGILSAYVLVLSVIPKFIEAAGSPQHRDYIGLVGLAAAVLLLVLSVVSLFDEDRLRSNYMHDNARDISDLYHSYKLRVIEANETLSLAQVEVIRSQYQTILDKCPFNHDPIDWESTSLLILREAGKTATMRRVRYGLWIYYDLYFWPFSSVVLPLVPLMYFVSTWR